MNKNYKTDVLEDEESIKFDKENLKSSLKFYFGFDGFKGNQEEVIRDVLSGEDVFVIMPTGGGKSLCYQLPALISEGTAVVVSPLIALMKNQVDNIRALAENNSIAHVLNSSLNKSEIKQVLEDLNAGHTKLLYLAPETLNKQEYLDLLKEIKISFFAIDEAHCISEWGHDFRPDYRKLREIIEKFIQAPIIALTATATKKVQEDIQKILGMTNSKVYKSSFNRPNLYYEVRPKINTEKEIAKYIREHKGQAGIIYCLSRKKVEEIAEFLQVNEIKALPYHAGLDAKTRSNHQDIFLKEEGCVIVATIAFGMGIDKPDVRFVIHYEMSKSLESYYQETGRAGRDGMPAECIAFYDYKDIEKLEKFILNKSLLEKEVGMLLLDEIVAYAETGMSRRKYLLGYFGEEFDETLPGADMDDNVRYPKKKIEAKKELYEILTFLNVHTQGIKAKELIDLFLGKDRKYSNLFESSLKEKISPEKKTKSFLMGLVRQALMEGFLKKEIENFNLIKIAQKGKEYLKSPYFFEIFEDHNYEDLLKRQEITVSPLEALDTKLLGLLKNLREKISQSAKIPVFTVFQEASLNDMATQYPTTLKEFSQIFGVGEGKVRKWGEKFVSLIKDYVSENKILKPSELIMVKQANHKVIHKVAIIQNIDRKINLKDIAKSRALSMAELIGQMEQIVYQGTKLQIDYYLEEIFDEEQIEEVFDYFMQAKSDHIENALEYFGDEYLEEEMRLLRIKFISDVAN